MGTEKRRTKRRYAHEIYPHAGEYEVRPLSVEVPCLYADAIGHRSRGAGYLDLISIYPAGSPERSLAVQAVYLRIEKYISACETALLADALQQGMTGDEAWSWAASRTSDDMEWVYDRAVHYGVPVETIKPYPVLAEPDHHDHLGDPAPGGGHYVTRVDGKESECPDCTEPVTETQDGE